MADNDSKQPIRSLAVDNTTEIADSAGTTINPAKEDGNLASIKTDADTLAAGVVGGKYQTNEAQIAGTAVSVNNGTTDAGTQRVTLSSDSTGQVKLATGSNTIGSLTANQSVNVTQVGGAALSEGQKTMSASVPVVIASDQSAIPVTFSNTTVELPQYNTASAIASNASSTQSYTPGSTVNLDGFDGSASGQAKWEFQYGTTGSETTKVVMFTSKGDLGVRYRFPNPISITSAMTVKLIRTNMDNQAQDLYSTILVH